MRINANGITLIALVITIIVLLILSGIVLNLTLGKNGIIERSKFASKLYQNAAYEEANEINELYNDSSSLLNNQLINRLTEENIGDSILYVAGENNYSNWRIYSIENKKVQIISDGSVEEITFSRI